MKKCNLIMLICFLCMIGYSTNVFSGATIDLRGETWFIMNATYESSGKILDIEFDPQAYNPSYRLKGNKEVIIKKVIVNENGKRKICAGKDTTFEWKRKKNITITYTAAEGEHLKVSGYFKKKKLDLKYPCVLDK